MPGVQTFYDGSRLLDPLVPIIGFDTDKLNLVFCQIFSIVFAWFYRKYLSPDKASREVRLFISFIIGVTLCFFCFGWAIKHIFGLIGVTYCLMLFSPPQHVYKLVFAFAMGYLITIHWYRWYILTHYYIDVTGPLMIMVQKVTVLAFSLHDGLMRKREELTEIQRREALNKVPPLLEYLSYLFQFQTVLTGPLCFYTDYMEFIDGQNIAKVVKKEDNKQSTDFAFSPFYPALFKLLWAFCCLVLIIHFGNATDVGLVISSEAWKMPWIKWLPFFWFIIFMQRVQYYYAWSVADVICNISGFGFNGFSESGQPKWDLVTNVDPWKVETAFSFKETLDGWNIMTMYWLRRIAYDRVPKNYRTAATYLLSTIWHGFFIGYYLTFLTGALITVGARTVRRCVRHHFQGSKWSARIYDAITFGATKFALMYTTFPFVNLHIQSGLILYSRLYFFLHLLSLFAILILPRILPPLKRANDKKEAEIE